MGRRSRARAVRPAVEAMEGRILLASQPLIMAALGDSLTDEYQFYGAASAHDFPITDSLTSAQIAALPSQVFLTGRDAARNWVMNIGANRSSQLSFGNFTTTSRGATRLQGFQENWALTGTAAGGPNIGGTGTTFELEYQGIPAQFPAGLNPSPGLITQTSPPDISIKDINVVAIGIGGNDYVAALAAIAQNPANAGVLAAANTSIKDAIASAISSIQTAATNAGNTSLKFVLVTTPDISVTPLVKSLAGRNINLLKFVIGGAVQSLENDLITTYQGNPAVGVVSSITLLKQFMKNPTIDGVKVNMSSSGQNYTDGFIGDGFHPGTIVQGLFAQAIVNEVNTLEGAQVVTPITDAQIVNYARDSQPTIAFTSSESTTTVGQAITFRATVTPALLGAPTPTGTVTFEEILPATSTSPASVGKVLGTVAVNSKGTASLTFNGLSAGNHTIAAIYNGDTANDARLSDKLTQTVVTTPAPTITTLASSSNPVSGGTPVTFKFTVTPQGSGLPEPTGTVTIVDRSFNRSYTYHLVGNDTDPNLPNAAKPQPNRLSKKGVLPAKWGLHTTHSAGERHEDAFALRHQVYQLDRCRALLL